MIGDLLEVITCNPSSIRGDNKARVLRVAGRGGLAFVRENDEGTQGTKSHVRLSGRFKGRQAIGRRDAYVRAVVVRPQYPVALKVTEPTTLKAGTFMGLAVIALKIAEDRHVEFVVLKLEQCCDSIAGMVLMPFGIAGAELDMPSRAY